MHPAGPRAAVVDGDVKEPAIPLAALPFCFTERIGYSLMKRSNKFGFHSIFRKARRTSARARREEGSTLYEFAMVALLLSTMLIGIVYGGIMAYDRVVLTNAVAIGARSPGRRRRATRPPAPTFRPPSPPPLTA